MSYRLTSENLGKQCVFVILDEGGKVCRTKRGLGPGISHTLIGRLVALIS